MKESLTLLTAAFAAVESFAATSVVYDASDPQTSYANGAVSVSYDGGGAITSITADSTVADGVTFTGDAMTLSSTESSITLSSTGTVTFANSLNAAGASAESPVDISITASAGGTTAPFTAVLDKVVTADQVICPDALLAFVTNVTGRFDKEAGQSTSGLSGRVLPCFYTFNGSTATVQFQRKTSGYTLRAVDVTLTQTRSGICAKAERYLHITRSSTPLDEISEGDVLLTKALVANAGDIWPGATGTQAAGYNRACFVTNLTLHLSSEGQMRTSVALSAANDIANAAVTIGGGSHPTRVSIANKAAFPKSGSVEVAANGSLWLSVGNPNATSGVDNGVPITVRHGGLLVTDAPNVLEANDSKIILDGGMLNIHPFNSKTSDQTVYLSSVTFRNGARIAGAVARVRKNDLVWKVEGTSSSFCDSSIHVWTRVAKGAAGYMKSRFAIDVDDVTEDSEVDFIYSGTMRPAVTSAAGYTGAYFAKTGAGTMRIDAPFAMTNTPTRIEAGMLLFNGNCLDTAAELPCHFVLAGGTFAVSAGSTNTCGTLAVESASAISVADGASLSFAASDGESWSGNLTLDCDLEKCAVRFGTGSDGLTRGQCAKISLSDGRRVRLDENGYVVESLPFVLIVR